MYVNCRSHFSFRFGALSIEEIVSLGSAHACDTLALTDIHSMAGCYMFARLCHAEGIKPVVGMEFQREQQTLYIALAQNMAGFAEINRFCSEYTHSKRPFPELPPASWQHVTVIYPWARRAGLSLGENEYLGVKPSEAAQIFTSPYRQRLHKLVIRQPVTYRNKGGYNTHRILRSIDLNVLLSQLPSTAQAGTDEFFLPPSVLKEAFQHFHAVVDNTRNVLDGCQFDFSFNQNLTKQVFTSSRYADMLLLEKLAKEGLVRRYGKQNDAAQKRMERELRIINELAFNAYFLITWDFVRYGQHRGFFHVGRGSGANSLVAYCLGITDVDPLALDLYFERFLNPKRSSPPDFDIDYAWRDRDEVIDYVLKRYGETHTALLATWNRFKARSALREVGKVFGLPKAEIDQLVDTRKTPSRDTDDLAQLAIRYAHRLHDVPSHLSIHAGGILISQEPIHQYTATQIPPKGFPISQFDMHEAEAIGLHKFDVLSQRGLGHIKEGIDLVQQRHRVRLDLHDVAELNADPALARQLAQGQTLGCFYIESPAMRGLLQKLRCDNYATLVAASSVIRPGVARSGMMAAYIERHRGTTFQYLHPSFAEYLGETYGVMVYQEDVLKVAHYFGGLSLADGDLLRRAMSGKTRNSQGFKSLETRFFANCKAKGYPHSLAEEVWRQMVSFAGYSFCKAHSASFAVESMQSLYLRTYYPLEFYVAVVNNQGGFYDAEVYLHEARKHGAYIQPPCVNHSQAECVIVGTQDIYIGLARIKGLASVLIAQILQAHADGPFTSLPDFLRRVPIRIAQLTLLIRSDAFRFTGKTKASLMWEAMVRKPRFGHADKPVLFRLKPEVREADFPNFPQDPLADVYDEMELLGFPLRPPFRWLQTAVPPPSCTWEEAPLGTIWETVGYLISRKSVKTVKGERMQFANFLDEAGNWIDVTLFPPETAAYPLTGRALYKITGKVVAEFGFRSLEAQVVVRLALQPDPRLATTHVTGIHPQISDDGTTRAASCYTEFSGGRGAAS